ncbi:50S ribosomal protein L25, partial [Spirochaetota bacterium]
MNVEPRKETGKNVARRMRESGYIPGVIYSHGETELVKVAKKEFVALFKNKISESVIFDINIK